MTMFIYNDGAIGEFFSMIGAGMVYGRDVHRESKGAMTCALMAMNLRKVKKNQFNTNSRDYANHI